MGWFCKWWKKLPSVKSCCFSRVKKNEKTYGRPTERTMRKDESHYNLLPQIISIISATYLSEKKKWMDWEHQRTLKILGFPDTSHCIKMQTANALLWEHIQAPVLGQRIHYLIWFSSISRQSDIIILTGEWANSHPWRLSKCSKVIQLIKPNPANLSSAPSWELLPNFPHLFCWYQQYHGLPWWLRQ